MSPAACAACFDDRAYYDEMMALTEARLAAIREATVVVLSEYMRGELVGGRACTRSRPRRAAVRRVSDARASTVAPATGRPACCSWAGSWRPRARSTPWRRGGDRGVPLPLVVAGTGPLREQVAAAGAEVLGWVAHARLPLLLRRARALLMPSRWQEPFGIAGLEALAFGVPVVAWESGGMREWHPRSARVLGRRGRPRATALRDAIGTRAAMPTGFEREPLMDRLERVYES